MASREETIRVRAPATSANLGAGFDVCGMALSEPFDEFAISKSDSWSVVNETAYLAAADPDQSVFAYVWKAMKHQFGLTGSLSIVCHKGIKPSAGMGSSASEASATAFAVNEIFSLGLKKEELVFWAGHGEAFAAGSPHYDNVAPCVLGGFTVVYSQRPLMVKRLEAPPLACVLVLTDLSKPSTAFARNVLSETIERGKAIQNSLYLSRMLVGFYEKNVDVILSAFGDEIVEPSRARAGILPNFMMFKKLGGQFAFATAASGAGPTLIAVGKQPNEAFSAALVDSFTKKGLNPVLVWTTPSNQGVHAL